MGWDYSLLVLFGDVLARPASEGGPYGRGRGHLKVAATMVGMNVLACLTRPAKWNEV